MVISRHLGSPGSIVHKKYVLEKVLGSGGYGTVWKGRRLQGGEQVAIKILDEDYEEDPGFIERFRREGEILEILNRSAVPWIVRILDHGSTGGLGRPGAYYLVMEKLEETLVDALERCHHGLRAEEAVPVFLDIARALAHAHANGIAHLDVKPDNVCRRKKEWVLIDWGSASAIGQDAVIMHTRNYAEASVLATNGGPCRVTAAMDIYSLGVVMYETLFGIAAVSEFKVEDSPVLPPPLASRAPFAMDHGLGRIVMRCLQTNPGMRFREAAEIVQALEALGQG